MIKRIIPCMTVLLCLGCLSCSVHRNANTDFNRVVIHSVNQGITTFIRVGCEGFEGAFGTNYKNIDITDPLFIKQLQQCLKEETSAFKRNVDVRAKVYLYKDGKIVAVYCTDRAKLLMVNNETNIKNNSFIELINKKIEASVK